MRVWTMALAFVVAGVAPGSAHVSFSMREVIIAPSVDLTLLVPHGCKGSPTLRLRMRIPQAVSSVAAHAKDGWSAQVVGADSARELVWSGFLPDREIGRFTFSAQLAPGLKPNSLIYFPLVQECETGVERWIDVQGKPSSDALDSELHDDATSPAPSLRLLLRR